MTTQQIINWIETRCKNNIEIHGTDKWNRDMEDLLELLKVQQPEMHEVRVQDVPFVPTVSVSPIVKNGIHTQEKIIVLTHKIKFDLGVRIFQDGVYATDILIAYRKHLDKNEHIGGMVIDDSGWVKTGYGTFLFELGSDMSSQSDATIDSLYKLFFN